MRRWAYFQKGWVNLLLIGILNFIFSVTFPAWGQGSGLKTGMSLLPTGLQSLSVSLKADTENPVLTFDWGDQTPALAVIKDHQKWWIVFDESAIVSLPDLKRHPNARIKSLKTVPSKSGGVVLQIIVEPEQSPIIEQVGGLWQISFTRQPQKHDRSATVQLPKSYKDGLTVKLEAPGREVRFVDSQTGYTHIAVPSYRMGFGVVEEWVFPEFHVMATKQGVGFLVLKDGLSTTVAAEQVTLMQVEGLAVTLPKEREQIRTKAMPVGLFTDAHDLDSSEQHQKINEELQDFPHSQHGPGELEIAWLLLSDGQPLEALGYLTHLARERPSIAHIPIFQILQGISSLLLHRFSEAEEPLLSAREEPEIETWLLVLKTLQNPEAMAPVDLSKLRVQLLTIQPILQSYPKSLRHQMISLILWAGIATKDTEILSSFLGQDTSVDTLKEKEIFDLAKTRVLMAQNKSDKALQMLGQLMAQALSPYIRSIAHFDYVTHRWETGMMKKEDVILDLERIRSQWRGTWLSHQIMAYLDNQKAREH